MKHLRSHAFHGVSLLGMMVALMATDATAGEEEGKTIDETARAAVSVLSERCHACHGVDFAHAKLNVLDSAVLLGPPDSEFEDPYITPGDLEKSRIWQMISDQRMPPKKPLSEDESETIRRWIEAGAPWPKNETREAISPTEILKQIAVDLFSQRESDREFQRYFTITHLHNNASVTDRDLRIYRAALSKALNSMSQKSTIVQPHPVDKAATIFSIDLRDYGWQDLSRWEKVIDEYPYGLKPRVDIDAVQAYDQIESLYGINFDGVPYIRADWFVSTATRPPLYHTLTQTPEQFEDLAKAAAIDIEESLKLETARRAGLFESGVSGQNRLIEYHSSSMGRFWISYDFREKAGRSNLARFPLGPKTDISEFEPFAFEHAGGEIIYNLPNGLHAYMLVDGKGGRINEGPVDIVWDSSNVSGSPLIVNGLSCINCHKHGILPFFDSVRDGNAIRNPEIQRKIREIFPPQEELDVAIQDSKKSYLNALHRTIGSYFDLAPGDIAGLMKIEEPISRVATLYRRNLDLETVASELGMEDTEDLRKQVNKGDLKQLGLGPLSTSDGTIKRSFWDSIESTSSVFQETAFELDIGRPVSQIRN
jgi:serine/threonine-protein kinase